MVPITIAETRLGDWPHQSLGKPLAKFILDRSFDRYTKLLAYDFIVSLHEISGIVIREAHVSPGCIDIALRLDSPLTI